MVKRVDDYEEFVARKLLIVPPVGIDAEPFAAAHLFPFQRDTVRWALKRGRAACFLDTGLGKTRGQLSWCRSVIEAKQTAHTLILSPLAVAIQTAREGERIGVPVTLCESDEDVRPGVNIINYERLHKIDTSRFGAVALDESSILKHSDSKTRADVTERFARTPFRSCWTATPAPNDHVELGNHAEFLGVMSRTEMLATYFCHDGGETQTWRLKGHAEDDFWRWVCSWAVCVGKPSDLGYSDDGYNLPPLQITRDVLRIDGHDPKATGTLFALPALSLNEHRTARRGSLERRVARVAELVAAEPNEQWLLWCELNDEADALEKLIPGAVQVAGSDTPEDKASRMLGFADGSIRVLVSKSSICGFGMNFQSCARMAFVGVGHSYESFYQSVRRCYRFGQTRTVNVHVVCGEGETAALDALTRKEASAKEMTAAMTAAMRQTQLANVRGASRESIAYAPGVRMKVPSWLVREVA